MKIKTIDIINTLFKILFSLPGFLFVLDAVIIPIIMDASSENIHIGEHMHNPCAVSDASPGLSVFTRLGLVPASLASIT